MSPPGRAPDKALSSCEEIGHLLDCEIAVADPHEQTRARVAAILTSPQNTQHLSVPDETIADLVWRGDHFFKDGDLVNAMESYKAAGATERLVALGKKCQGARPPSEGRDVAAEAYAFAGALDGLVALGDSYLHEGYLEHGMKLYRMAGRDAPREKLIACGDAILAQLSRRPAFPAGCMYGAREAYGIAAAREKLEALAELMLEKGYAPDPVEWAINTYAEAGALEKLVILGDCLLGIGNRQIQSTPNVDRAQLAYAAAGKSIPEAKLLFAANRCLSNSSKSQACRMFAAAGAVAKLVALGNQWLDEGRLWDGQLAYSAANQDIPAERLTACGDTCRNRGFIINANEAYALASARSSIVSKDE